jgi:RecB family exonuclease
VPAARTVHQALGTAIHSTFNSWLRQYQKDAVSPSKEWVLHSFARHLRREVLAETEAKDVLDVGTKILTVYFDQYAASFNPRAVGEFDFAAHSVRVGPAAITGKIDKIEWLDDACTQANVVDYKTGQPDGKSAALKPGGDYHRQLVFYQLLCDLSPRFTAQMVSGEIDFVQPNKKGIFVRKRIQVAAEDRQELRETIERVWQEIQALRFLDPATWCRECEYCASLGVL